MEAEYTPVARHLPAVFGADPQSLDQLDGFLAMVDELHRAYLDRLEEVPQWLSPAAAAWPPGAGLDAGADAVLGRVVEVYDALAGWFAFTVPASWGADAAGIERRRAFLARAARIWRRRGTPRGFLAWFCLYFGIDQPVARPEDRPVLLEHFKFGRPVGAGDEQGPDPGLRATLLVPVIEAFGDYLRRQEVVDFVGRYAPSHVLIRVCWVAPGFRTALGLLPTPDPADAAATEDYRRRVRRLLCSMVDVIDHGSALHLGDCIDEGRSIDRLDVGRLPTHEPDH